MTAPGGEAPSTSGQESGVLYLGHLPHGFYEDQLRKYFSQFGVVTKVRVSRNKKSGKAKGYAFLQFQSPEVAKIAAEAMDSYMLCKQKLVVRVMAPEAIHPQLWKGANRTFSLIPWRRIEEARHNAPRTPQQQATRAARVVRRDKARQRRLAEAGIDYEYEPLERPPRAQAEAPPQQGAGEGEVAQAAA